MVTHLSDKLLALRVYFGPAAVSFTFFRIFTRTWTPALLEDLSASTLSILVNFFYMIEDFKSYSAQESF